MAPVLAVIGVWRYELHDWHTGARLGRLRNMSSRRLSLKLNQIPTLTATAFLSADNPLSAVLMDADWLLIVAYRRNPYLGTWEPKFSGPCVISELVVEAGKGASFALTAFGAAWRFSKRIADDQAGNGRTEHPGADGQTYGLTYTGQRGHIAARMIRDANQYAGNTWVRADVADQAASGDWSGGFAPDTALLAAVEQLSDTMGGIDWEVQPVVGANGALLADTYGLVLGKFRSAPVLGTDRSAGAQAVIFESGIGRRNVTTWKRRKTLENYANRVYHAVSGANPRIVDQQDNIAIGRLGLFEEALGSEIVDRALRQALVDLHVAVRGGAPRKLLELTPARSDLTGTQDLQLALPGLGNVQTTPIPTIDYQVGDRVLFRAALGGTLAESAALRIYGIDIDLDELGAEVATLSVYPE